MTGQAAADGMVKKMTTNTGENQLMAPKTVTLKFTPRALKVLRDRLWRLHGYLEVRCIECRDARDQDGHDVAYWTLMEAARSIDAIDRADKRKARKAA